MEIAGAAPVYMTKHKKVVQSAFISWENLFQPSNLLVVEDRQILVSCACLENKWRHQSSVGSIPMSSAICSYGVVVTARHW